MFKSSFGWFSFSSKDAPLFCTCSSEYFLHNSKYIKLGERRDLNKTSKDYFTIPTSKLKNQTHSETSLSTSPGISNSVWGILTKARYYPTLRRLPKNQCCTWLMFKQVRWKYSHNWILQFAHFFAHIKPLIFHRVGLNWQ